jgi:hypothetical protein
MFTSCVVLVGLKLSVIILTVMAPQIGDKSNFGAGTTKGGSITVPLTSCLTGLDYPALQTKTKIVSCYTAYSKPVKQEFNGTVILPPLVFPVW